MLKLNLQYSGHQLQSVIGKDPDAGKDGRQRQKKGEAKDEMVREHHCLNAHEFEQTGR